MSTPTILEWDYTSPTAEDNDQNGLLDTNNSYVLVRVDAGYDVTGLNIDIYAQQGNNLAFSTSVNVSSGLMSTDGTYDYYVVLAPLGTASSRNGIGLSDSSQNYQFFAYGNAKNFGNVVSGPAAGTPEGTNYKTVGDLKTDDVFLVDPVTNIVTQGPSSLLPICFTQGTRISAASGERAVEKLRAGDLVWTLDHGLQRIRWIGRRVLRARDFSTKPHLRPIRLMKGSLGRNKPTRDLMVSPQHRILLRSHMAEVLFGSNEVLVAAKFLVNDSTIRVVDDLPQTVYFHLLFDAHEIVRSDGQWTESFHPGAYALGSLPDETRQELFEIFPELRTMAPEDFPQAARPSLRSFEAEALKAYYR